LGGAATGCVTAAGLPSTYAEGSPAVVAGNVSTETASEGVRSNLCLSPTGAQCAQETAGQRSREQLQRLPPRRRAGQDAGCFVHQTRHLFRCLRHYSPSTSPRLQVSTFVISYRVLQLCRLYLSLLIGESSRTILPSFCCFGTRA
jgi:hypothetical protein